MHPKEIKHSNSEISAPIYQSPNARKLEMIFNRYHLADPYKFSGPVIRFPFRQNGRSIDQVISGMNLDFGKKKLSLYAEALPECGAIEVYSRDGPGFEAIREYVAFKFDTLDDSLISKRKYLGQ